MNGMELTSTKMKIDPSFAYTVVLSKKKEVDDKSSTQASTTSLFAEQKVARPKMVPAPERPRSSLDQDTMTELDNESRE